MMPTMQRLIRCWAIRCWGAVVMVLACPLSALAQDEREYFDARLEGYQENVALDSSTALTWVVFILLAVVALGGMFKNAKRTHLD